MNKMYSNQINRIHLGSKSEQKKQSRVRSPKRGQESSHSQGSGEKDRKPTEWQLFQYKGTKQKFSTCSLKLEMSKTSVTWSLGWKSKSEKALG